MSLSARTKDLTVEQMQDDLCVYDFRNQKCHALNKTSAQVWRLCDGKSSVDEIASGLGRQLGTAADVDITLLALKQLRNNGLLEGSDPQLEDAAGVSRRSVMKKFGIAAASAPILLPLIESIVAPTPAAAQSGVTAASMSF
ncbi:MAG: PqqD family protein [Acidobacteriaceae bacterium]|nr:PqqD family protein [Acidobacteriaceae bacterium]